MNVFFHEIRAYRKNLFFWSGAMVFLVGASMAKFATLETAGQSVTEIFGQFPKSFQVIFGLNGFDVTSASGYYGVVFLYLVLMATIHAVLIGTDIISKEERDKTAEFLLVKPISRARVISAKLGAGLINIVLFNLVTLISSIYFTNFFNKGESITGTIILLMSGLFMLQLLFFFVGASVAAASKKPKASASIATTILLFTFILSFFVSLNESIEDLKYLTPFKYFDAHSIINDGRLEPLYVAIATVLIATMVFVTYTAFIKRDTNV
jgi:beta-exotoxin I transport system permease protein